MFKPDSRGRGFLCGVVPEEVFWPAVLSTGNPRIANTIDDPFRVGFEHPALSGKRGLNDVHTVGIVRLRNELDKTRSEHGLTVQGYKETYQFQWEGVPYVVVFQQEGGTRRSVVLTTNADYYVREDTASSDQVYAAAQAPVNGSEKSVSGAVEFIARPPLLAGVTLLASVAVRSD